MTASAFVSASHLRALFGALAADEDDVEVRSLLFFSLWIGNHFIAADHGARSRALPPPAAAVSRVVVVIGPKVRAPRAGGGSAAPRSHTRRSARRRSRAASTGAPMTSRARRRSRRSGGPGSLRPCHAERRATSRFEDRRAALVEFLAERFDLSEKRVAEALPDPRERGPGFHGPGRPPGPGGPPGSGGWR